ncbi:hypothetical protein ACFPRL_06525 [Pseudoclavibacter helvolus]
MRVASGTRGSCRPKDSCDGRDMENHEQQQRHPQRTSHCYRVRYLRNRGGIASSRHRHTVDRGHRARRYPATPWPYRVQ